MSFIRQELRYTIWRYRDALIGIAVSLFGAYWTINGIGFVSILGMSVVVVGALFALAGIQRGRFRGGLGGAGVVQVDEGEVT